MVETDSFSADKWALEGAVNAFFAISLGDATSALTDEECACILFEWAFLKANQGGTAGITPVLGY